MDGDFGTFAERLAGHATLAQAAAVAHSNFFYSGAGIVNAVE